MAKTQSRVLRKREYAGERDARPVVEWLEQKPQPPQHRRIERLLDDLATIGKHFAGIYGGTGYWTPDAVGAVKELPSPIRRAVFSVQKELARYRSVPRLFGVSGSGVILLSSGFGGKVGEVVWRIAALGRSGFLDRLRRCVRCRKWFYARFRHKQACSTVCQRAEYKASPEWREHRREYMRHYRRENTASQRKEKRHGTLSARRPVVV